MNLRDAGLCDSVSRGIEVVVLFQHYVARVDISTLRMLRLQEELMRMMGVYVRVQKQTYETMFIVALLMKYHCGSIGPTSIKGSSSRPAHPDAIGYIRSHFTRGAFRVGISDLVRRNKHVCDICADIHSSVSNVLQHRKKGRGTLG